MNLFASIVDNAFNLSSTKVNPSTPRPEGQALLRVDPEPRFLIPSLKTGVCAAERVKKGVLDSDPFSNVMMGSSTTLPMVAAVISLFLSGFDKTTFTSAV